uniref:DRMBL domain-containing protein n=1 Tax=Angiostrongylus cantonensis TaxID=6313 RepID=A0A0K0CXT8_ANGCA
VSSFRTDGEDDVGEENVVPKCGKIIIGKCFIAVDRFVRKDSCKYHFLTHAHVDHYANLNKTWKTPIYCSEITARILPTLMGKKAIPKRLLLPLKVGETHEIEPNFHVGSSVRCREFNLTLKSLEMLPRQFSVEAILGASIPGGSVLCTGDFRADNRLICRFESDSSFKKLAGTYVSKIYFDNTHLDHTDASFPSRTECEEKLMREMEKHRCCNILIPVFRLGREEILEKLSKCYSEVISTSNERLMVRRLCGLNEGEFREDNDSARIRTSHRQPRYVLQALANMKDPKVVIDLSLRGEYNEIIEENLITIPYSDHSSRAEIIDFLSRLRFGELVPISAPMDSQTAEELMKLSKEINRSPLSRTTADVQKDSNTRSIKLGETKGLSSTSPRLKFDFSAFRPADMSVFKMDCGIDLRQYAPGIELQSSISFPRKSIKIVCYDKDGSVVD